jgi:hypothetical protein
MVFQLLPFVTLVKPLGGWGPLMRIGLVELLQLQATGAEISVAPAALQSGQVLGISGGGCSGLRAGVPLRISSATLQQVLSGNALLKAQVVGRSDCHDFVSLAAC